MTLSPEREMVKKELLIKKQRNFLPQMINQRRILVQRNVISVEHFVRIGYETLNLKVLFLSLMNLLTIIVKQFKEKELC